MTQDGTKITSSSVPSSTDETQAAMRGWAAPPAQWAAAWPQILEAASGTFLVFRG